MRSVQRLSLSTTTSPLFSPGNEVTKNRCWFHWSSSLQGTCLTDCSSRTIRSLQNREGRMGLCSQRPFRGHSCLARTSLRERLVLTFVLSGIWLWALKSQRPCRLHQLSCRKQYPTGALCWDYGCAPSWLSLSCLDFGRVSDWYPTRPSGPTSVAGHALRQTTGKAEREGISER